MPLVSEKTYSKWFSKDHFMRKQFNFIYKNALWDKKVPQQYSLCPYFWKSLILGMIIMRFVIVPLGLACRFFSRNILGGVDALLVKAWKSSFDQLNIKKDDGSRTGYEDGSGFLASLTSIGAIGIIFIFSMGFTDMFLRAWENFNLLGRVMLSGLYACLIVYPVWGLAIQERKSFYAIVSATGMWIIACLFIARDHLLDIAVSVWQFILSGLIPGAGFPWLLYIVIALVLMYIGHKLLSKDIVWMDEQSGQPLDAMTWELNGYRLAYLFAVMHIEDPYRERVYQSVKSLFEENVEDFKLVHKSARHYFYKKLLVDLIKENMCGDDSFMLKYCAYSPGSNGWTDMKGYYAALKKVDGSYLGLVDIRDYFDNRWKLENEVSILLERKKDFKKWIKKNRQSLDEVVMIARGKRHKMDVLLDIVEKILTILWFPASITIVPIFKFLGAVCSYTMDVWAAKKEGFCPLVTLEMDADPEEANKEIEGAV